MENTTDGKDKYCIIIFDEMKLNTRLEYNAVADQIVGFVDDGFDCKPYIADHVQVWLIKGGQCPWKHPIIYSFCKGATPWQTIAKTFKDIVKRLHDIGIKVIASICDQGSNNIKAINSLIFDIKRNVFNNNKTLIEDVIIIDGQKIIPIYDLLHLIKCIRNNLLTKDLSHSLEDGRKRVAKWSDIISAYNIDRNHGAMRLTKKNNISACYAGKNKKDEI